MQRWFWDRSPDPGSAPRDPGSAPSSLLRSTIARRPAGSHAADREACCPLTSLRSLTSHSLAGLFFTLGDRAAPWGRRLGHVQPAVRQPLEYLAHRSAAHTLTTCRLAASLLVPEQV